MRKRTLLSALLLAAAVATPALASAQIVAIGGLTKVRPFKAFDYYSAINCEEDGMRIANHQGGDPIVGQAGATNYGYDVLNGIGNTANEEEKLEAKVWCPVDMKAEYLDLGNDGHYYGVRVWAADRNPVKGEMIQCRMIGSHGLEDLSNFTDFDNLFDWEVTGWVTTAGFDGTGGTGTTGGHVGAMNTDDPDMIDLYLKDTYEFTWFTCEIPWSYKRQISTLLGYSYGVFN